MTNPAMALAELAEKGADVTVLRQMPQFMAQPLMELDVDGRCRAGHVEKSPHRLNSRSGYRERTLDTRTSSVELKIPKLASDTHLTTSGRYATEPAAWRKAGPGRNLRCGSGRNTVSFEYQAPESGHVPDRATCELLGLRSFGFTRESTLS